MSPQSKIEEFRRLHQARPLVLPNAWDAASARLMEQAGAKAAFAEAKRISRTWASSSAV